MPICRAPFRSTAVLLALATASCGSPATPPTPPTVQTPTPDTTSAPVVATADAEVTATVEQVLTSATHPGLHWGSIPDVAPALKPLYDAEADRLLWFDGARPGAADRAHAGYRGRGRAITASIPATTTPRCSPNSGGR